MTTTRVTLPSGKVLLERADGTVEEEGRSCGFVVDTQPDLQVGQLEDGRLLVASQDVAGDPDLLARYGVTHILNVAGFATPNPFPGIRYLEVTILDVPEESLEVHFPNCFAFIDESLATEQGHVLVHCNAGVSRSVSIVTAYIMRRRKWTLERALEHIRMTRPSAKPNEGFIKQLKVYEMCCVSSEGNDSNNDLPQ